MTAQAPSPEHDRVGKKSRQRSTEVATSTIEIHEPEVQEIKQVNAGRGTATVLPTNRPRLWTTAAAAAHVRRQRARVWGAAQAQVLRHQYFVCFELSGAVPLMFTEQLPKAQLADVPGGAATSASPTSAGRQRSSCGQADPADLLNSGGLRTPTKIPQIVQMIKEQEAPPPMNASGGVVGDVPGGIPGGHLGAVIGSVISSTSSLAAVPRFVPATPTRIRISGGVTKGLLIHREEPTYPTLARAAGVQGDVVRGLVVGEAFWAQCTYEVVAEYHSPVPPSHSFGLPIWSSNEATLRSNRVTITVGE